MIPAAVALPSPTDVVATQVRMANDIARQFAHLDDDAAAAAVAAHIARFWDKRMKAQLREAVETGDDTVDALVVAALDR